MTDLLTILTEARSGAVVQDLNNEFSEVLQAVLDTGGSGELTIKLKIEPSKKGFGGVVVECELEHSTKMKKPKLAVGSALFYVVDGDLRRDDPAQTAMFESADVAPAKKDKKLQ